MGLPIFGTSNYTSPHWEPEPTTRGTWSIVQSCIITLALCVYTAIHVNVVNPELSLWSKRRIRFRWMFIALLAPEFIVFNAWIQRRLASLVAQKFRLRMGQEEPEGIFAKTWRVLCSVFRGNSRHTTPQNQNPEIDHEIQVVSAETSGQSNDYVLPNKSQQSASLRYIGMGLTRLKEWIYHKHRRERKPDIIGLKHGFLIVMGGLAIDRSSILSEKDRATKPRCLTITPLGFMKHFTEDRGSCRDIDITFITAEAIDTKQKADVLGKTIVLIQALWFCVQFITRIARAYPVSLLELNTFAHALCALTMYVIWWYKPVDIEEPFVLNATNSEGLKGLCVPSQRPATFHTARDGGIGHRQLDGDKVCVRSRLRNFSWRIYSTLNYQYDPNQSAILNEYGGSPSIMKEVLVFHVLLFGTSLLYSGIHLLAWDSKALNQADGSDRWWKASCLLLLPFFGLYFLAIITFILWAEVDFRIYKRGRQRRRQTNHRPRRQNGDSDNEKRKHGAGFVTGCVFIVLNFLAIIGYLISRAYLQVEVFLQLPYLDPGIYKVPRFAAYWPHL